MSHCLRVSPFHAPPPLLLCRPRRARGGRGHGPRHAPRPILTLARFDPPPLLRLKVSDSSDCPPAAAHHRLPRPRALIGSLASVWREGLFLVRCSVFAAVLSVAAALSWYAQLRARAFVEARLLPAACELLGDYLQREVRVGKVRSVSPLGITLHTCSVGPHADEFSCAEVPVVKIRIRPFASLRRGRVVVDALLSDPTALVAQKKDFSWLGIPAPSEGATPKRNSEEEGIDYRTKTRRLAREEGGEQWIAQRDTAAREAAERGYIVPSGQPQTSRSPDEMLLQDDRPVGTGKSSPPLCADEMHRKDRHMDPGIDSSSKHADLEKTFGVKSRIPGLNFWSRMIPNPTKRRHRRKAHSKVLSDIDNSSQERILRRSAQAAAAYFQNIDSGNLGNSSPGPGSNSSDGGHTAAGSGKATPNNVPVVSSDKVPKNSGELPPSSGHFLDYPGPGKSASATPIINTDDICKPSQRSSHHFDDKMLVCSRLEDLQQGHTPEEFGSLSDDNVGPQQEFTFGDLGSCSYAYNWASFWPFQLKGSRVSFNAPYASLGVEIQKFKSRFAIGLGDAPAELVEGVGQIHPGGAQNTLPITLDSVYFSGGNLMLLGYGDQEPRVFLHNASGWYGDVPVEASGDFGLNPEDGEFHLMCQLAGAVTAVFNCQGPLDAPVFVGSGIVSRKSLPVSGMPPSAASEAVMQNKEAGAVAAFDHIPFSHVSANFTFNLDNCVADLYGIRACLLDGGEIRGAGNAWICPEGEVDDSAMDINLSGSILLDKVLHRYIPGGIQLIPLKIGELNGETRLSGPLIRPKFDIKWAAPNAEDSFSDARGNIVIAHDYIKVNSSSVSFDLSTRIQTSYIDDYSSHKEMHQMKKIMPLVVEGVDLDLRMRGFEFAHIASSIPFDSPRPLHLKASGRLKFQGKVVKPSHIVDDKIYSALRSIVDQSKLQSDVSMLVGEISLSGIKLNQLMLAPQSTGFLSLSRDSVMITMEKSVLEQSNSKYELQGEYVFPGTRDRFPMESHGNGFIEKAMGGHLGSIMSSMGRWRMRLEVPDAEVAEMLPLARLLSRSTDPVIRSRSKELFMQCLHSVGFNAESLRDQIKAVEMYHDWLDDDTIEDITLPALAELRGYWRGSLDASGGGNGDTMADFDFNGEDWEWGTYKTQRVLASGSYSNNDGLRLDKLFIQKDNATLHADGSILGPLTNLHFAVLNFPVGLIPALVQALESSTTDSIHFLRHWLTPIKGILHMEGDLRGTLAKPECDVQIRLLDGTIGGIDLGRAEVLASVTPTSRFVFDANFEPTIQSGHVNIQGSIPVTYVDSSSMEENLEAGDGKQGIIRIPVWAKDRGSSNEISETRIVRDKPEDGWEFQLAESLKGLSWNFLEPGEVRVNADIKDGGMMLITALSPYANWLQGYADVLLQVKGTVDQPVVDGSASFHRATVTSPFLRTPLTNFAGNVNVISNRLCINSMESRVGRKGKLSMKGTLPLQNSEPSASDKIELKCEVLDIRAKNVLSGQVDSQLQVTGSILRPDVSGMIRLSHGEAYLPHDKGNGAVTTRLASNQSSYLPAGFGQTTTSQDVSRFLGALSTSPDSQQTETERILEHGSFKPNIDARLNDLKLTLGPELRIVYPLILNFAVSGDLELNGMVHPKYIRPKGILTFENGEVNLVATQVRLKNDHLNVAKFEPDLGLDPVLDLVLVGSEWQFKIMSRASMWQDNLVVTSTRSVDQDVLSPSEAAKVFESQLAESLLEGDGQLAFKKLATATLETLMPRIEGKGEFGQARWRLVYAPQIPSLLSVDPTVDPLKSLANNISFATEVEVQLGKRLQASVVRQMKDSEMAMQWSLIYQLTSRLRVLFQSTPSNRLLFEYSATSQD
ncbi:hypothetical protein ACQ4PT_039062 [Festuca glaucescens]